MLTILIILISLDKTTSLARVSIWVWFHWAECLNTSLYDILKGTSWIQDNLKRDKLNAGPFKKGQVEYRTIKKEQVEYRTILKGTSWIQDNTISSKNDLIWKRGWKHTREWSMDLPDWLQLQVLHPPLRSSEGQVWWGPPSTPPRSPCPTGRRIATTVDVPFLPHTSVMELGMGMRRGPKLETRLVKASVPVTAHFPSAVCASMMSNVCATKITLTAHALAHVKHIAKLPLKWPLHTAPGIKFLRLLGLSWREGTPIDASKRYFAVFFYEGVIPRNTWLIDWLICTSINSICGQSWEANIYADGAVSCSNNSQTSRFRSIMPWTQFTD